MEAMERWDKRRRSYRMPQRCADSFL